MSNLAILSESLVDAPYKSSEYYDIGFLDEVFSVVVVAVEAKGRKVTFNLGTVMFSSCH